MFANFISESCTGTTGDLTLTGASFQRLPFSSKFSDTDAVSYVIEDANGINKCGGVGTYNSGGTITRSDSWTWDGTTYDDDPSGNLTLTGGTHIVRVTFLADDVDRWGAHLLDTDNPHSTDIGNLGTGTLAELNTKITDATLDTSTDARPPIWSTPIDGNLMPDGPFLVTLGSDTVRFVTGYFQNINTGSVTVSGSVDGRDIAADGAQLDTNTSAIALNTAKVSAGGSIDTHSDVDTTGKTDGKILTWINASSEWQPRDPTMNWSDPIDSHIVGDTDAAYNIGSSGVRPNTIYTYTINAAADILVGGLVDGRDIAADGSSLDANVAATALNTAKVSADGAISSHSDVDTTGATDGQVLTWVNASSEWQPTTVAGGSGDAWGDAVDADIIPGTDNSFTLGDATHRFLEAHLSDVYFYGELDFSNAGEINMDSAGVIISNGSLDLTNSEVTFGSTGRFISSFIPKTNNVYDIGSSGLKIKDVHATTGNFTNLVVTGNVDGRDISADGTILDALADGPTENVILIGTKTASQNVNGATNKETDLTWDVVAQDASELTSMSSGDSDIVFTNAGWVNIHASAYITDGTVVVRVITSVSIYHYDSSDTLKYSYHGDMQYYRDDASPYDSSGGSISQNMMYVAAGDYVIIRTRVVDGGDAAYTQYLDTTYSKIRVAQIVF